MNVERDHLTPQERLSISREALIAQPAVAPVSV